MKSCCLGAAVLEAVLIYAEKQGLPADGRTAPSHSYKHVQHDAVTFPCNCCEQHFKYPFRLVDAADNSAHACALRGRIVR
eukprot:1141549-Pelagomonas_calceolata.AAC.8